VEDQAENNGPAELFRMKLALSFQAGRSLAALPLALALAACRPDSSGRVAERILDRHRDAAREKPLPASQVIRMRLSSATGEGVVGGVGEIAWEPQRYRERTSSAGLTTERGIQAGKAYDTDEDGVTRVVSEPVLRELLTRSYFWRRAWLFEDRERARVSLGPAGEESVSVRLVPRGGNVLLLSFSRRGGRLLSVRSPRFDLDVLGPGVLRERSGARPPVRAEIAWIGLPTGRLPDAAVGGGCGRFSGATEVPIETSDGTEAIFPGRVNGLSLRIALDAAAGSPSGVSLAVAAELGIPFERDAFGRFVAGGATLEVGGFSCRGIHLERLGAAPDGAGAVVGGALFREAVVELDPAAGRLRLHDPARWVAPPGFTRIVVDDDGNRPVTTLRWKGNPARLLVGSRTGSPALLLAPPSAQRLGIGPSGVARGLRWGPLSLPDLLAGHDAAGTSPAWGDDGRIGFPLFLEFHSFLDMSHRWIYLAPRRR